MTAPQRAPDLASAPVTSVDDNNSTASFVVRPGSEHWPTVVADVSRFLSERTADIDLVADVETVLSRVLWEFLRHSDSHGAVVEVIGSDDDRVVVEVSAGLSAQGHDLLHALPPGSGLTQPEPGTDDRAKTQRTLDVLSWSWARTQRTLDALSWSWGTERRHRKTTLRFTIGSTPGARVDHARVTETRHSHGIHPADQRSQSENTLTGNRSLRPFDQVSGVVVKALDLTSSLTTSSGLVGNGTVADEASRVAHDAALAASRAAYAAEYARVDRATAAAEAAQSIAVTAAATLRELSLQQDERAAGVAAVAAAAAEQARRSAILDGDIDEAAVLALRVASDVAVSAALAAEEAPAAAVLVADAVTAAADAVAAATATAARAAEVEVEQAAAAMQVVTAAAAERRSEHDSRERVVLERREKSTATTLQQLMHTNQSLRDHMRRVDAATVHATTPIADGLPSPDGLTLAVRPVGGLGTDYVGEHWYDAYVTPSGGTVLIVGSIAPTAGRTAEDAQRIRHLLLALVVDRDGRPAATVERLQRCVHVLGLATEISLTIAQVCPPEGDSVTDRVVLWCGVGSPAPLVIDREGVVSSALGAGSTPLTGHDRQQFANRSLSIESGSTVLLHSVGVLDGDVELIRSLRTVDTATDVALDAVATQASWRRPETCGTLLAVTVR